MPGANTFYFPVQHYFGAKSNLRANLIFASKSRFTDAYPNCHPLIQSQPKLLLLESSHLVQKKCGCEALAMAAVTTGVAKKHYQNVTRQQYFGAKPNLHANTAHASA